MEHRQCGLAGELLCAGDRIAAWGNEMSTHVIREPGFDRGGKSA
jgi:hypothetical protein